MEVVFAGWKVSGTFFVFASLTDFLIVLRVPTHQKLLPFGTALEGTTKGGDSEVSKLVL